MIWPILFFFLLLHVSLSFSLSSLIAPTVKAKTLQTSSSSSSRRELLHSCWIGALTTLLPQGAGAATDQVDESLQLIQQARKQLDAIPDLIKAEKWDSVRAILIAPPLSDCWAKTNRPLLMNFAQALETAGGDELAALEAREEANSHLRYLDMAAYNNVFNPIKTVGETGATKGLIKSYYEDPINEYKASVAAIDELIQLAKGL